MNNDSIDIGVTPCHPGDFVSDEALGPLELSIPRSASIPGIHCALLSELVNEKASLSAGMALRLEKAFGIDMGTLLQMQAWHDASVMYGRSGEIQVDAMCRRSIG